jgi:hypothetical protein
LPDESEIKKDSLKSIDMYPYKLTLSNFKTRLILMPEDVELSFYAKLEKDSLLETNMEGHSLVFEIRDEKAEVSFEKEFALEKAEGNTGSAQLDWIKLGPTNKYVMETQEPDFIEPTQFSGKFRLNVYDSFMGYKRLVASKQVAWFGSLDE